MKKLLLAALFALASSALYSYSTTLLDDDTGAFYRKQLQYLPMGPSWLTAAESFYLPVVVSSHDLGSFGLNERSFVNLNGYSAYWQKTYLNGNDISHPGEPGKALIDIPFRYANTLQIYDTLPTATHSQGWHYKFKPEPVNFTAYNYGFAATVGGPTFIPEGVLDREPPQLWGAPKQRRSFLPSHEIDAQIQNDNTHLFAESIIHRKNFISTSNPELAMRNSFFLNHFWGQNKLTFGFQHLQRSQEGADFGENDPHSLNTRRLSGVLKFDTTYRELRSNTAVGFGQVLLGDLASTGQVKSLEDIINNGPAVYPYPMKQSSFFWDNNLSLALPSPLGFADMLTTTLHLRYENVSEELPQKSYTIARTYLGTSADVFTLQSNDAITRNLATAKLSASFSREVYNYSYLLEAGFSGDLLATQTTPLLTRIAPSAVLKGSLFFSERRTQIFGGLRHDIIPITQQEARMLAGTTAWAHTYWDDINNDGSYQTNEAGAALPRSGSAFTSANNPDVPFFEEAVLGASRFFARNWQALGRTVFRYYSRLYQVDMGEQTGATYEVSSRPDVEGGVVYNRTDNNIGQEYFTLTNQKEHSTYIAFELQLLRLRRGDSWFLNASGGAYYHIGYTPPGNDVLNNDIGVITEATADKNAQLNLKGRTDGERGYMFKIIAGFSPLTNLTFTNSLHYRDGIPVGQVIVLDGVAQGPTIMQKSLRANAEEGMGRFAFYMQWDMRLIYERPQRNWAWFVALDVYNINDFRLELKEKSFYDNNYRNPVESMSPRMIRLSAGARF